MRLLSSFLAAGVAFAVSALALQAEDWKTISGKVYPDVKVIKVEPDAVTILYRDGGARIPLSLLPEDLQKRFHYDPVTARAAADARLKTEMANVRALIAERQQQRKEQQVLADAARAPSASDPPSVSPLALPQSTHHAMDDAVQSGWDSHDGNHLYMGQAYAKGSISRQAYDSKHYGMESIANGP